MMRLPVKVSKVGGTPLPGNVELVLLNLILNQMKTHVNCFGSFLFHSFGRDAVSRCVVTNNNSGRLRVSEVLKSRAVTELCLHGR